MGSVRKNLYFLFTSSPLRRKPFLGYSFLLRQDYAQSPGLPRLTPVTVCSKSPPYLKISTPLFWCSVFVKKCFDPQVSINKMVNEHSVSYHPSNSNFRSAVSASSLPKIFVEFSVNSVYPTMFGKYFQICGVQIIGKCICESAS